MEMVVSLNERELGVVRKHRAESQMRDGVRVVQWPGACSVYYEATGRMWVAYDTARRESYQELYFFSTRSVCGTLTCSHPLKFWDLERPATPRETARVQGFPEHFVVPATRYHRLLANAVAVPCAAHAVSCVVDAADAPLTMVDLCAGVGGFAFAAHRACGGADRVECVGFSEVLPAAVKCYRANFPDVPALGDATAIVEWPRCDLLTAGFPCQPFSHANSRERRASHTKRGFFETVLDAVAGTACSRVVFENVVGLRNSPVWTVLCDSLRDLGFTLDHAVLDARDFGLPQARKRLYLVGRRDGTPPRPVANVTPTPHTATLADVLE